MSQFKITQVSPYFDSHEKKQVLDVLASGWITEGPKSKEFVESIQQITKAKYAVLAPNGTLALYVALMALGITKGDEVIVPDFTFIASANSIYLTGAAPVFVDVNSDDLNINPVLVEKAITKRTRAIMPVHIYGQGADMDKLMQIAKKHNLLVIEDAAQVLGVHYKKKHLGTFGDMGCISFFADKSITTGGEGGIILTNTKAYYENLLYFRNQGRLHSGTFVHPQIGYNFRMTDLQSAVGLGQLAKFKKIAQRKVTNDLLYKKLLKDVPQVKFVERNFDSEFIPFRSNVLVENLENLLVYLESKGIQTRRMFYPLHSQPCYKFLKTSDKDYPNSINAYNHGLSLPVHYHLKTSDIHYICQVIKDFYASVH